MTTARISTASASTMKDNKNRKMTDFKVDSKGLDLERKVGLVMDGTLCLQSKDLIGTPEFTKEQEHTRKLYLDFNVIKHIPDSLFQVLHNLVVLSVIGNDIERLSSRIGDLLNLEELYINENNLEYLPDSISKLTKLNTLNIVGNRVKLLPIEIGSLQSLRQLHADENLLQDLPESFGSLIHIEVLELADNKLLSLPESFGRLSSVHTLNLSGNNLRNLPESFSELSRIRQMDLSENSLEVLPSTFASARILEKLFFSENSVTYWPDWMGNMPHIQEISAEDNRLTGDVISEEFGLNCQKLKVLNLAGNYVSELPASIGCLSSLESLHLGSCIDELERRAYQNGNRLTTLPDTFCRLTKLRYLRLDENKLTSMPQDIGLLTSLDHLDLGQNHLRELPDSFCHLRTLRLCQLSRNQLSALPDRMDLMTGLRDLRLDNNLITSLPSSLGELTNLQTLDLFHNKLTAVPAFVHKLINLNRLDLLENDFQLKVKDVPRVWSGINYPQRDPNLKDNWRGQVRHNHHNYEARTVIEGDEDIEQEPDPEPEYNEHLLEMAVKHSMSMWRSHTGPAQREKYSQPTAAPPPQPVLPPSDVSSTNLCGGKWITASGSVNSSFSTSATSCESELHFGEEDWGDELAEDQLVTEVAAVPLPGGVEFNPWQDDDETDCWNVGSNIAPLDYEGLRHKFVPSEVHPEDTQKDTLTTAAIAEEGQFDDADDSDS